MSRYIRFAALGDSTTAGLGDPTPAGWRGWARLLADALATTYDVSFCNVATPGATAREVRDLQVPAALTHQPDMASLIVGVNDTMRSAWDAERLRIDLLGAAGALHGAGAALLTLRFHDHGAVLGLPALLRRPLAARIARVNDVYEEIHAVYGGIQVDLSLRPEILTRPYWSIDRMHPSERGHRALATAFADRLVTVGLPCERPGLAPAGGCPPTWRTELAWITREGAPWMGRRARDLGPWAIKTAAGRVRVLGG
jgi:lysophospholipase L1-like esterase